MSSRAKNVQNIFQKTKWNSRKHPFEVVTKYQRPHSSIANLVLHFPGIFISHSPTTMRTKSKTEKNEYRIMQLRNRAVQYRWIKRRKQFTWPLWIPKRLRGDMERSPNYKKEVRLWKLFRKWEVVQEMRETLPDRTISRNTKKLDLIRMWIELRDPTVMTKDNYKYVYWDRYCRFDRRHYNTTWTISRRQMAGFKSRDGINVRNHNNGV